MKVKVNYFPELQKVLIKNFCNSSADKIVISIKPTAFTHFAIQLKNNNQKKSKATYYVKQIID